MSLRTFFENLSVRFSPCLLALLTACESGVKASNRGPELAQAVCTATRDHFVNVGEASPETLSEVQEFFEGYAKSRSTCMLNKKGDPLNFSCVCEPGSTPQEGSLGIVDFGNPRQTSLEYNPGRKLERLCSKQVETICGPFEAPIELTCRQGGSECVLYVSAIRSGGGYHEAARECKCQDGRSWSEYSLHREKAALSQHPAKALCKQELAHCASEDSLGPGPSALSPDSPVKVRTIGCGKNKESADGAHCWVTYEKGELKTYCVCQTEEHSTQEALDEPPSYAEMRERCYTAYRNCEAPALAF